MLYPAHRAGLSPASGRRRPPVLSAVITPLILLSSPLAAHAAGAPDPSKVFADDTLTDGDDVLTVASDKTYDLVGDYEFGGGDDAVTNNGTLTIGAKATDPTQVTLRSLEGLKNKGLIDLRNGHVGDVLTIAGDYNGSEKARLGLDFGPGGADKLVVGDVANGKTAVVLTGLSAKDAVLTGDKGPVLIQAGADSTKDAFYVENSEAGLIHYTLAFDSKTTSYRLQGAAGQPVYQALKISEGAATAWRAAADAWSAHVANVRDAGREAEGGATWGQAYGGRQDRDDDIAASDRIVRTDYRQTTYGGQMGVDLVNGDLGDGRILLGLTGGFADSKIRFDVDDQNVRLRVLNLGAYVALTQDGFFVNALAKADRQTIKAPVDTVEAKFDGTSFGAQVEAGVRSEGDSLTYEKLVSLNYVSTRLDDMKVFGQRLDFDNASGFVAKIGVRGVLGDPDEILGSYGAAFVVHDFTVKDSLTLVSGDQSEHLSRDGGRTYGQVTAGFSFRPSEAMFAYIEATGDFGGGRQGGGLRVGARVGF